ncbi:hypothetical protein CQW23_09831 [Capsicum baccatum]|uniref:Uncharacterized protein n=1 Tax=Capsicum baccatum TaxID=33114 RepID=A0A2G2WXW9_CAPBA|nr:hypothetical protein CQW23_09831 [Capsicum baccatum]
MLRKELRQIDIIKSSRSGSPNFEAHEVEANDLQAAVIQYLQFRGDRQVHVNASSKTMPSNMGIKGSSSRNVTLFMDTLIVEVLIMEKNELPMGRRSSLSKATGNMLFENRLTFTGPVSQPINDATTSQNVAWTIQP